MALQGSEESSPVYSRRLLAAATELYAQVLPATLTRLPAHPALLEEAAVTLDSLLSAVLLPRAAAPQLAETLRVLLRLFQEAPPRSPGGQLRPGTRSLLAFASWFLQPAPRWSQPMRPELELPQAPCQRAAPAAAARRPRRLLERGVGGGGLEHCGHHRPPAPGLPRRQGAAAG